MEDTELESAGINGEKDGNIIADTTEKHAVTVIDNAAVDKSVYNAAHSNSREYDNIRSIFDNSQSGGSYEDPDDSDEDFPENGNEFRIYFPLLL